uniref:Uncharacterized protein n=1 Tax=Meloidogyne incognita TaxID=6306 RepID=A0A914NUT9_MELIC
MNTNSKATAKRDETIILGDDSSDNGVNNGNDEQKNVTAESSLTIEEMEQVRAFINEQRKKKEAAEARRRRSATKTSTESSNKTPAPKKAKTTTNNESKNIFDPVIKAVVDKSTGQSEKEKQDEEELHQAILNYQMEEEEDESSDQDSDEEIDLGENEEEYKQMRLDRKLRKKFVVPEALLNRAQIMKDPRSGIFVYQCESCRNHQKKREYFLFKIGHEGLSIITIELCAEDLDKNISLAMHYNGYFGNTSNNLISAAQSSSLNNDKKVLKFSRGAGITKGKEKKLLNLVKYCWILHQCSQCRELTKKMATDLFLQKSCEKFELSFLVCSVCSSANIDHQQKTYNNVNKN